MVGAGGESEGRKCLGPVCKSGFPNGALFAPGGFSVVRRGQLTRNENSFFALWPRLIAHLNCLVSNHLHMRVRVSVRACVCVCASVEIIKWAVSEELKRPSGTRLCGSTANFET